jgi:hypothetical protein
MQTTSKMPGLFDVESALEQIEKNTKLATDLIVDKKSREITQAITQASMAFARAQSQAAKAYGEAVKQALLP